MQTLILRISSSTDSINNIINEETKTAKKLSNKLIKEELEILKTPAYTKWKEEEEQNMAGY